jgi:hypothetical protein
MKSTRLGFEVGWAYEVASDCWEAVRGGARVVAFGAGGGEYASQDWLGLAGEECDVAAAH